jgi:hypothetical protein
MNKKKKLLWVILLFIAFYTLTFTLRAPKANLQANSINTFQTKALHKLDRYPSINQLSTSCCALFISLFFVVYFHN